MNEDSLRGIVREIFPKRDEQILYNAPPIGYDMSAQEAEQAKHREAYLRYTAQILLQKIDPIDCKMWSY